MQGDSRETDLITVLVQFRLPASLGVEEFRAICRHAAPDFLKPEGLLRKHFLLGEDGRTGGGVYLWRSRKAAERFYGAGFRQMIAGRFGDEPTLTYFDTPVIADAERGRIEEA